MNAWHSGEISRREVLRVGGLVGFGLSLPMLLEQRARGALSDGTFGRAKSIISLYLHGGHPQQETFDPKPDGPSAVRGEFKAISTSLPGVQFSEVLPKTARIAHRLAVVRSEVLQVIDAVPGVDHVLDLELVDEDGASCGNLCLGPAGLVVSGVHRIEVSAE